MVSAGDFRNGITFEEDGNVYQIIEFQHVKPGKGGSLCSYKNPQCDYGQRSGENI